MSGHKTAGAGSPVFFACASCRSSLNSRYIRSGNKQTRTGKVRPRKAKPGSAMGIRSMHESHEYTCTCGFRGWSSHRGVMNLPLEEKK